MTGSGSPGPLERKTPSGLRVEHILGGRACGHDGNFAVMIDEQAQNVLLDAEIVGDHLKFALGSGVRAGLAHVFRATAKWSARWSLFANRMLWRK